MAFTFIATAEDNQSSSATTTINVPTGTANGDIMFALIQSSLSTISTMTPPSGWTLLGTQNPSSTYYYWLYYRVASSEPASYTWTVNVAARLKGIIATYRGGFNPSSPIDVVSNTAYTVSNTSVRAAAMTVSATDSALLYVGNYQGTTARTFTKPSQPTTDWVEDYDSYNASSDAGNTFCSMVWTGSGSTGDIDGILSSSSVNSKHAFAVALNPQAPANNSNFFMFM